MNHQILQINFSALNRPHSNYTFYLSPTDGTSLSDYKLIDGSKLNLVLKRRENNNPSTSAPHTCETGLTSCSVSFKESPTDRKAILVKSAKTTNGNKVTFIWS